MTNYTIHPAADIFPMLEGENLQQLVEDIKANGLINSIKVFDGQIIDGRNRLRACNEAGIPPVFETLETLPDPMAYIIATNLHRRHLTTAQHAALVERGEKYKAETFGRILSWSRQAMINDDLSAFTRSIGAFGQAAARLEADLVYGLLLANPVMSDGKALFHADHGNLNSGLDLSLNPSGLGYAKAAMRKQKDVSGKGYLNIVPRYLIVGAELEFAAEQLLAKIAPAETENAIPEWVRQLEVVIEPRIEHGGFYLAADPNQAESIELAYLNGMGPHVEEDTHFSTDAFRVKCRLDVGVAAVDWVGINYTPAG